MQAKKKGEQLGMAALAEGTSFDPLLPDPADDAPAAAAAAAGRASPREPSGCEDEAAAAGGERFPPASWSKLEQLAASRTSSSDSDE
jgi:hypothetical protein